MIKEVYVDGAPITNDKRFLQAIKGSTQASIDVSSYARGGRSGVALSTPFYRNFGFSMDWAVVGDTIPDLVTQRDSFLALFALKSDKSLVQTKQFRFILSDDSERYINAVVSAVNSDIDQDTLTKSNIQIQCISEREYFNGPDKTETIYIFNGGGMAIPMAIPMDMSVQTGTQIKSLVNDGNVDSYPIVRVYGPMNGFDLVNQTTGETLSCTTNLVLSTNYIDFDFYNRTALLGGTTNVLHQITGTWWWLVPGTNLLKMVTASTSQLAHSDFTYHDAYSGI
jgi:hypothetical protein